MTLPAALEPLIEHPRRSGVLSDFDGTLAPIVDDPAEARPLDGAPGLLAELAGRVGRVAVISGRPARFLLDQLGGEGISIWGLYGLERAEGDEVVPVPDAEAWRAAVRDAVDRAQREVGDVLGVEDKGLTFTLHYRRAPEQASVAERWARQAAEDLGLELHSGRMSYELRPPVPHGKGNAVEKAAEGLDAVCFFGDDHGDLHAFDALDQLAAAGTATVRVAVNSDEAPPELLDRADLMVEGPEGVLAVLRALREAS